MIKGSNSNFNFWIWFCHEIWN